MKKIMKARSYCKMTGFPVRAMMERLVNCSQAGEFAFRTTAGKTAPWYIDVEAFEKKLERGDFREVLET